MPDGVYTSEIWNNPLGTPLRYPVKLTVQGDGIEVDFDGAPPQLPRGGLNSTLNYTAAHATYPLKCMLTPNVRGNAGCYRPFTVKAPEGSILNPRRPASVNIRTRTGWYIAPNIFRALADAAPAQVQAFTGLPVAASIYGQTPDHRIYSDLLFMGGGQGASAQGDGKSGLLWPTSAANTSIELFETRVPVLVLEKAYLPDSGGPGRHRGGLGQRVRIRKLDDDGQTTLVSVYPEGVNNLTPGLFGGLAGRRGQGHGAGARRPCAARLRHGRPRLGRQPGRDRRDRAGRRRGLWRPQGAQPRGPGIRHRRGPRDAGRRGAGLRLRSCTGGNCNEG